MYHDRNLLGQPLLELALTWILLVLFYGSLDFFFREKGENLDISLGILVRDIEPELLELVWRCPFRVGPDVAVLGLAELSAVSLPDERTGQCVCVSLAEHPADKLRTRGDVAPLVASAHFQTAILVLVEPQEVISLEKLVAEFREGHASRDSLDSLIFTESLAIM